MLFTSTFWTHLHKLLGVELRMSSAYHPESDGSTERANRTITQMLRQCIQPSQKDWVTKLPAIEFAVNIARSTGYALFFLNTGRMPRSLIWEHASDNEYPGVRAYAQKVKFAIMSAHDSILAAHVKQTRDANRRRRPAPFAKGDLAYVATKNMSLPKGLARKLVPKYIGPYLIIKDFGNNSYWLDLSLDLKRRGIHDVFHSSLLRVHEPNNDRLFPGRLASQVSAMEDQDNKWVIDKFESHRGSGPSALFEAVWQSGDRTWVPYETVKHLNAFNEYLVALGVSKIQYLPEGSGAPPMDNLQIFLGCLVLTVPQRYKRSMRKRLLSYQDIGCLCQLPAHPSYSQINNLPSQPYSLSSNQPHVCTHHPAPMPYRHPRISRREDGGLVLKFQDCQYSFTVGELYTALFFDLQL